MLKKVLSLILCLCMCVAVVLTTASCGKTSDSESSDTVVPTTMTLLGITSETTTPEAIQAVEDAINKILKARYKTKVELNFVTEDEYISLVKEKLDYAKYLAAYDNAIVVYNKYMKDQASSTVTTKKVIGNWIQKREPVKAETLATRLLYVAEQTTVHEDGTIETLYPEARSPIDIVMISDESMYDLFDELGLLVAIDPNYDSYKNLQKFIYPTYFSQLKSLKGQVCAIPNNNMLAEYTYLLVDKKLADKYEFNIGSVSGYADLSGFLASVKANENVIPFEKEPDALGIFNLFSEDIAIGSYFDPMNGYQTENTEEKNTFEIKNLFDIPEYTAHLKLMEEYRNAGYFTGNKGASCAVKVVTGDASIANMYNSDDSEYYVKVIQNPFVLREAVFDGMFAVTAYTSDSKRAMEVVEAINTDAQIKNLLQYGIEGVNYTVNEDDTVTRLNNDYMMDNALTGNVYMGHLEEGMANTSWAYVKQTNLASALAPSLVFPVDEQYLEANLDSILKRAALSEALEPLGISYTEYTSKVGTSIGNTYSDNLKQQYKAFFLECLRREGVDEKSIESMFSKNAAPYNYAWYENEITNKIVEEKYSTIKTAKALSVLINTKMYESVGAGYKEYQSAKKDATDYYANIESLRILTRLTLFTDMTDEEYEAKYGSLASVDFENAVLEYVRENYIKNNNISEDDYDILVKNLISSQLVYYDSNNQSYTVSWEQFEQTKANAGKFTEAVSKLRESFGDLVMANGYNQEQIDAMSDINFAAAVHDALYYQFYSSYNHTQASFEESVIWEDILTPVGLTYAEFNSLKRTDSVAYNNHIATLKKTYKKELLKRYTKDEYESLKTAQLLNALLEIFIEDYTNAYGQMCDAAGISYDEYVEYKGYMDDYTKYVNKMKTSFTYTLKTIYTDAEINSFSTEDIEKNVYDAVYNYGYYTNEMAKYVGLSLSKYMNAKSSAVKYNNYISALVEQYSKEITSLGLNVEDVKRYNPEDIEELIYGIVEKKDFSSYKSVEEILADYCKPYIDGIKTATDIEKYCKDSSEAISKGGLFTSLIEYLNENLQAQLSK